MKSLIFNPSDSGAEVKTNSMGHQVNIIQGQVIEVSEDQQKELLRRYGFLIAATEMPGSPMEMELKKKKPVAKKKKTVAKKKKK